MDGAVFMKCDIYGTIQMICPMMDGEQDSGSCVGGSRIYDYAWDGGRAGGGVIQLGAFTMKHALNGTMGILKSHSSFK